MGKLSILGELFQYLNENKLYWIAPIILVLVLFGILLIAVGAGSPWGIMLYAF